MREQLKQQLRDMIMALGRAEAILDSKSKKKAENEVKQLLEDMQNSAIAIGNVIEESEGLETETVSHLEEYCELLWQYMTAGELKERFRFGRMLAGKRSETAASLEQEIEGRLEVAFLLCRADWWKQMEGIWLAARENPLYDCRILVSPYTEYGNGTAGALHDEREMFPPHAEAMDYGVYDMEGMKPDLVFVDGPYGTCMEGEPEGVCPEYDFGSVREWAEAVVYMPVYEEEAQVQEADCRMAQVRDADMVVVPDEGIREIYIGYLRRLEGGAGLIRKICVSGAVDVEQVLKKNGKAES